MNNNNIITINNKTAQLEVNLEGGAITNFHLIENKINPLSFESSKLQMPPENRNGAPFRGQFICFPYWGDSYDTQSGENELPKHGLLCNSTWQCKKKSAQHIQMNAEDTVHGFSFERNIYLSDDYAMFKVTDEFTNNQPFPMVYNLVQHPTLAAPFLDKDTVIDCNGGEGFNQSAKYENLENKKTNWPQGRADNDEVINLRNSDNAYNGVFSFAIHPSADYGWMTASSPNSELLLAYVWSKDNYPWINIWKHYEENKIKYTGIEFGTTGIHGRTYPDVLNNPELLGTSTFRAMPPKYTLRNDFYCFILPVNKNCKGIENIKYDDVKNEILIVEKNKTTHTISKPFDDIDFARDCDEED